MKARHLLAVGALAVITAAVFSLLAPNTGTRRVAWFATGAVVGVVGGLHLAGKDRS